MVSGEHTSSLYLRQMAWVSETIAMTTEGMRKGLEPDVTELWDSNNNNDNNNTENHRNRYLFIDNRITK